MPLCWDQQQANLGACCNSRVLVSCSPLVSPAGFQNQPRRRNFLVLDPWAKVSNVGLKPLLLRKAPQACDFVLLFRVTHQGCGTQPDGFSSLPVSLRFFFTAFIVEQPFC
ncbi:unnamed protein product [Rangifer tarandus platyrhynchus]|uniref:Uncharacterized protein n=2 Tax=Rangifer tarandus platyrhynchus TaxID=3082113 RepID=A0AC59Z2Q4_RANTA|nr:unnamed protein product [Rangifer tarandus platyrhynchus]